MNYNAFYLMISEPFRKSCVLRGLLKLLYYAIPAATVIIYVGLIAYVYSAQGLRPCSKVVLVPFVTLIIVTVFRHHVNADRPVVGDGIEPLIKPHKNTESFPSRHTASLAVISMAGLYCNIWLGILLWVMTLMQGIIRIISGAHYPKDIAGGIVVGLILGLLIFL